MSSSLVDWPLLGRIVLASVLAGVGLVVAFSLALAGLSFARDRGRRRAVRYAGVAMLVVMGAVILGALGWGFAVIINKG